MSEVVQETHQEFWRPPVPVVTEAVVIREALPMAEACPRCSTEFLLGSRFCHTCGVRRPEAISAAARADAAHMAGLWEQLVVRVHSGVPAFSWSKIEFPTWLRYLHFHEIKSRSGLSTASLIAFILGVGCVAGALLVGLADGQDLCGLAGHPVLSRGMAAGGDGGVRGGNSAEETNEARRRRRIRSTVAPKHCLAIPTIQYSTRNYDSCPAPPAPELLPPELAARRCWPIR